eukprot:UN02144
MLSVCGYDDVIFADFQRPKSSRFIKQTTAIVNFLNYRSEFKSSIIPIP